MGTDHDTAAFAVEAIRRWWNGVGQASYPGTERLLITADAGGSNGYRTRAWKTELAAFAAETVLAITVCHLSPGTSKPMCPSTTRLSARSPPGAATRAGRPCFWRFDVWSSATARDVLRVDAAFSHWRCRHLLTGTAHRGTVYGGHEFTCAAAS